jgi:hypothetical protein
LGDIIKNFGLGANFGLRGPIRSVHDPEWALQSFRAWKKVDGLTRPSITVV